MSSGVQKLEERMKVAITNYQKILINSNKDKPLVYGNHYVIIRRYVSHKYYLSISQFNKYYVSAGFNIPTDLELTKFK